MKKLHTHLACCAVLLILMGLTAATAVAYPVTSDDLVFDVSSTPIVSGSGRLDIIIYTGNAVANATGIPNPNGGLPGTRPR